ncbi:TRAP transporter large permease [Aquisalimonas asiatica]|uniref:TRAP transporter large permease protein n=1 Tax=Aquisalimonas asiatica TaxID=406100 RepID=A0A1H8SVH9_9GAMM|nr:TRAP transporter large permease [Aquisalimonas asiatica]SEO82682.1 TRAP transporter, DctM subunit [Aquisalimonas asiatica]
MTDLGLGLTLIALLFVLVIMGLHIAVALMSVAFVGVWLVRDNIDLAFNLMYIAAYNGISNYIFATIPLFVLMGLLVSISNVGRDTFDVAASLLRRISGGLGIATVSANTVFAAVTGVSIASAAVFTKVAVPEMARLGYNKAFAAGTVAGSSVLGMMIPPSLLLIVYGILAEVSIGHMFLAGVLPGLLLAVNFVIMILLLARFAPNLVYNMAEKLKAAHGREAERVMGLGEICVKLVPILLLVALVLGGLYSGFFTPTEAGGVGAFGALVLALARRSLNASRAWQVLWETGSVAVGILILLIAASFYSRMLAMVGMPAEIAMFVQDAGFGPYGFLLIYVIIVLLLGMILDSTSILLIMTPIAVPIAQDFGFHLVHFGIITVIAVEIGLLTPPFGISIYTVKSTLNDPNVSVESIFVGVLPFVAIMLVTLIMVATFPLLTLALI